MCGCLSWAPHWEPDLACNLGMCTNWESNQRAFCSQAGTQSSEPHQPGRKLFILMKSHLFILSFMSFALGDISVKILVHGIPEIFLPMLSSRIFMVWWLIFKFFLHLGFIFVYAVSWWLSFIFLHVAFQISQHHLLKRLFLLHFMLLPPLLNTN